MKNVQEGVGLFSSWFEPDGRTHQFTHWNTRAVGQRFLFSKLRGRVRRSVVKANFDVFFRILEMR